MWLTLKDTGKVMAFDAKPPFEVLRVIDTGPITNHVNFARTPRGQYAYVSVGGQNEAQVFRTDNFERCAIFLGGDPEAVRDLQDRFPSAELIGGDAEFEERVAKVVRFVEAPRIGLDLPLDVRGTAFQQRVWQALREVPAGSTASYTEIAQRVGAPKAVRAVALSGYRWGVERKRALIAREGGAV